MTIRPRAHLAAALPLAFASACVLAPDDGAEVSSESPYGSWSGAPALSDVPCVDGLAAELPCQGVDLLAFIDRSDLGGFGSLNDIWGWTDPQTGREYALVGRDDGTAFVDISEPTVPVFLGLLPTHSGDSPWRDVKVYADHAYIVSEASGHGLQIFDLTELRDVTTPQELIETAHYDEFGSAHNIAINEESGYAYAVGSDTCDRGLHMIDLADPIAPAFAGCFSGPPGDDGDDEGEGSGEELGAALAQLGEFPGCSWLWDFWRDVDPAHGGDYTHDTQCVIYRGPHEAYQGRELCFNADGKRDGGHLTIADVTDKENVVRLAAATHEDAGYIHQGWLTEDHEYFILGDELDEEKFGHNTRTFIYDVRDLHDPKLIGIHEGPSDSIDHNQYVKGRYLYQANYEEGLRILDTADIASGELEEVGYFRTMKWPVRQRFRGAWSIYPFFESGVVIVSSIDEGLFILRPHVEEGDGVPRP